MAIAIAFSYLFINFVFTANNFRTWVKECLALLFLLAMAAMCYLVISKCFVTIFQVQVLSYQGMNSAGEIDLSKLPNAIYDCYQSFIPMKWNMSARSDGINNSRIVRILLAIIAVLAFAISLRESYRKWPKPQYLVITLALIAFTPLAVNCVHAMSTDEEYYVHTLMQYSLVIYIVLLTSIIDNSQFFRSTAKKSAPARTAIALLVVSSLSIFPVYYWYTDSTAYYRMALIQREMESWFTVLISQIKECPGYSDNLPVAFIGNPGIQDDTLYSYPLSNNGIMGYNYLLIDALTNYAWKDSMRIHTGYAPLISNDTESLKALEAVKSMPCYPDDGSIAIVDRTVVVKFSDVA